MKNETKNISYIGKNFTDFKSSLTEYTKTYFPDSYGDFTANSVGNIFIEQASYIGDVLSFYINNQILENFVQYARTREALFALAYEKGYRPKVTYASVAEIAVSQYVGTLNSAPNLLEAIVLPKNTIVKSNTQQSFITMDEVDFSITSGTTIVKNGSGYTLTKYVNVVSAEIKTTSFTFGSPQKYSQVKVNDENIIGILDVTDSLGNPWYEVPYLAQDTVMQRVQNNKLSNPKYSATDGSDYLLKYVKVPRRFTSRFSDYNQLLLEFGAGTNYKETEELLPNADLASLGTVAGISKIFDSYNRFDYLTSKSYGIAPGNTTLTVRYLVGGGIQSNLDSDTITGFNSADIKRKYTTETDRTSTVTITNDQPSVGGRDGDTKDELRLNIINSFSEQERTVTKRDYIARSMMMPSEFGAIAKVYIEKDDKDPLLLNLYTLAYDSNKKLAVPSLVLKENLKEYLSYYRAVNDTLTINNAYYVNVGINFDIVVYPSFNASEVIMNSIIELKSFFAIDNWQINQPIVMSDIYNTISKIKGVQVVTNVEVVNISGGNYSPYAYDVKSATKNNIIYPPKDPSCFEVRFLDNDIKGRSVSK